MPSEKSACGKDLRTIERVLKFLIKLSSDCWHDGKDLLKEPLDTKANDTFQFLSRVIRPIVSGELNSLIENEPCGKLCLEVNNFYLPPFYEHNKEFVPVLHLDADFAESASSPKLDLRIALVTLNYKNSTLCIFGYRYEMPHADSVHNYCHQQFTRKPLLMKDEDEKLCEIVPGWAPEHIPCTITPAKTPVEHLICMLIGLYGSKARDLVIKMDISAEYKRPLGYLA